MKNPTINDSKFIIIIVTILCLIYIPYILSQDLPRETYIKGDCFFYRATIKSILADGDLLLSNNIDTADPLCDQLALGQEGFVPKHPIIMPLFSIPFYFAFGNQGLLLFNIMNVMILIVLLFKLNRLFFDEWISFSTVMIYAVGTLFLNYVYNYSPDIFSTVMVVGGLYCVLTKRYYVGAFLLGLSLFAKVSNSVPAGIICLYAVVMIFRESEPVAAGGKRAFAKSVTVAGFAAVFLLSLFPLFYTNQALFGSPFVTGYNRTAVHGTQPEEIAIFDHATQFNQPLLKGTVLLLFYKQWGIIPTNPILIFSFLGVLLLYRKKNRGRYFLLLCIFLAQFVFFAKYEMGGAGYSHFSNRFLMTPIALSSVFTGNFLEFFVSRFLRRSHSQQ